MRKPANARRRYLASAVSIATALGCGAWPLLVHANAVTPPNCARANLLRLVTRTQAAWVGTAVLPQLAHPTSQALVQALESRLSFFLDGDLRQPCDTTQLHLAFQEAVKADFAQGRCLSVGGWVLATSEVELCALAALSVKDV